jgi:glycosyltransferase involved in cell wall biosynthesis
MINSLIIEVPKSLIVSKASLNGANKISDTLIQLTIKKYADKKIFVVTDASKSDFGLFKKNCGGANLIYTQYHTLGLCLQEQDCEPDLGFVCDLKAHTLTEFRNYFCYSFPIVSLIHSLGSYNEFMKFKDIWELMGSTDMLICPSPSTQQTAIKLGAFKNYTTVINYGVDLEKFHPLTDTTEIKKKLGIDEHRRVISLISRINPYMKMDIMPLLRQMPKIIKQQPNCLLMIVGVVQVPDYVEQVKKWASEMGISDHILWVDAPDQDHMEMYYQVSDIFVSLSDNSGETFGLTVIEAMATAAPVILSNISGYKVHIEDGKNGIYVPTYSGAVDLDPMFYSHSVKWFGDAFTQSIAVDAPKLRASILSLLEDQPLCERLGSEARKTVETRNTLEKMMDDYVACFEGVVKKSKDEGVKVPVSRLLNVNDILGHFTSNKLENSTELICSDYGKKVTEEKQHFFAFDEHVKRYRYLSYILRKLVSGKETVHTLEEGLCLDRSELEANILYMLKHDLIEVV